MDAMGQGNRVRERATYEAELIRVQKRISMCPPSTTEQQKW